MSDRDLSAALITEVGLDHNRPAHLFEAEFDAGTLRLTDALFDLDYGGNTYTATQLLGHSQIQETRSVLINKVTVTLSGVDQSIIAIVLADDFLNRPARIYTAFLDADHTIIDVTKKVEGRLDAPRILTDPGSGSCSVGIDIVPRHSDFARNPGRRTNNADQQIHFPGDKGFEFVTEIPEKVFWGRPEPVFLYPIDYARYDNRRKR
jgi:hypothetical protein